MRLFWRFKPLQADNYKNVTAGLDHVGFSIRIRVYYEDTDFGGVVYYANYLKFMERARTEYLRSLGFDQSDLFVKLRRQFVVRTAAVEYVSPARFDDVLLVDARISNVRRASLEFSQSCTVVDTAVVDTAAVETEEADTTGVDTSTGFRASPSGRLVATGKLLIACLDADSHKPRAIPGELIKSLRH